MRASARRTGARLLLAASLSVAGSAAHASELLVMPYACTMVGGRPLLTPGPEQSHAILGGREQRTFTACSPANPGFCRTWTVYRFDISCEGTRVPWVSVVASIAEETTHRAWLDGGRLMVRMPPSWSLEPGDPCARPPSFDDRFGFGRMRRYCADRRAMAPPPVVEMPFGFAPMLGFDGIFVRAARPGANAMAPPPPPPPVDITPPAPPPVAAAPTMQPPRTTRSELPAPQAGAAPAPAPRPPHAADGPAKDAAPPPAAPPPKAAPQPAHQAASTPPVKGPPPTVQEPQPAATPSSPIIPRIINRPDAANTDTPDHKQQAAAASPAPAPKPQKTAEAPTAPRDAATQDGAGDPKADASREPHITVNLLSAVRSPTVGMVTFGMLALALLAAFALARRRDRLTGAPPAHDLGAVSLDGRKGRGQLVPRAGTAPAAAHQKRAPPPVPRAAAQPPAPALANRIPQTRSEALQILGMGVSPHATDAAIKKIVDGLRQSWHPDLARNDADRRLREFRIKQINAAWELIAGKRVERLDS